MSEFHCPENHPRYQSLRARHLIEEGIAKGITHLSGLAAHGRGEAFDYMLGEKTQAFAERAIRAAAAMMVLAERPIISANGNTSVLVREEMIELSRVANAPIEINIFNDAGNRRELIFKHFQEKSVEPYGLNPDALISGLTSARARVDSRGMFLADVVLVSLEDGDRTECLIKGGKKVIAIDLNPLSRTPQMATISIVDNVQRALPLMAEYVLEFKEQREQAEQVLREYDNAAVLKESLSAIRAGFSK